MGVDFSGGRGSGAVSVETGGRSGWVFSLAYWAVICSGVSGRRFTRPAVASFARSVMVASGCGGWVMVGGEWRGVVLPAGVGGGGFAGDSNY